MASRTIVLIPSNGANIIQTAPGLSSVALQASGATPYPQYGAQQLGIPTNAPQQVPQKSPLERFLKAEPKVLGAVQIMIGLLHIGFGAASHRLFFSYYLTLHGIGGYPFWGGIFFISSGSLCVAAVHHPSPDLVKSSVGMNITSAIMALTGIMLCMSELIITTIPVYNTTFITDTAERISYGVSSLFLLFSVLEFCIAVSLAHFGCQATCCSYAQPTNSSVPYQVIGDEAVTNERNPLPPPIYNNMFISSGSLCVAAAKHPNRGLVKSSVGMNITSSIMSLSGIILYICELRMYNACSICNRQFFTLLNVSCGLSILLLLFSVLEFCIAVSLAHFGCQAACLSDDQPTVLFVPYQVIGGGAVAAEPNPPPAPPTYNNVVTKSP